MEPWDVDLLAVILAILAAIPLLAQGCASYATWMVKREVESEERCRTDAERRAHSLLRELLTANEYRQLKEKGYLTVHSTSVWTAAIGSNQVGTDRSRSTSPTSWSRGSACSQQLGCPFRTCCSFTSS